LRVVQPSSGQAGALFKICQGRQAEATLSATT
jgi:hypothetical protein